MRIIACNPFNETDYEEAVQLLDSLIDHVGEDQSDPLASLMETISVLIEKYEDDHIPEITGL
jgi:HTH-type transcriptional regulator/antitoxin HigA